MSFSPMLSIAFIYGLLRIESILVTHNVRGFKPSLDLRARSIIFTIIVTIVGSIVLEPWKPLTKRGEEGGAE